MQLFKAENKDYYLLPGGRMSKFEDSLTTIKREMLEELGFSENYKLVYVLENILKKENKQSIELVYFTITDKNNFISLENNGQTFEIVNINKN